MTIDVSISRRKLGLFKRASDYLDALFQNNTKVVLEVRGDRLVAKAFSPHMALGFGIGSITDNPQQIGAVSVGDWRRLNEILGIFDDSNLQITQLPDQVRFGSKSHGWTFTVPASDAGELRKLPDRNLLAKTKVDVLTLLIDGLFTRVKDETEKPHKLDFGWDLQKRPMVQILDRDQQVMSKQNLDFLWVHAHGFRINPAHLHDGLVLLKEGDTTAKIEIYDDPDLNCRMVRRVDNQDYLLIANFR